LVIDHHIHRIRKSTTRLAISERNSATKLQDTLVTFQRLVHPNLAVGDDGSLVGGQPMECHKDSSGFG
jgi:hypothetical protein